MVFRRKSKLELAGGPPQSGGTRGAARPRSDWRKYLTLTAFSCIIVMEKARYMETCRKGCMGAATRMEEAG